MSGIHFGILDILFKGTHIMKKIEQFLENYGTLCLVCIVVVWVLWGIQTLGPIKSGLSKGLEYQKNRNIEEEYRIRLEVDSFAKSIVSKAKADGKDYSPKRYFGDLRALTKISHKKGLKGYNRQTSFLQELSNGLVKKGYYSYDDVTREANVFRDWRKEFLIESGEAQEPPSNAAIFSWFLKFYWRTMILIPLFYIIKMRQRRGILITLLAEKKRFVLAIIFWPVYVSRYPNNVIREIRVEAELRRLGNLFRSLSPKEVRLIREIAANGSSYRRWLKQKRIYRRGLFLAIMVTLFFSIFIPTIKIIPISKVLAIQRVNCQDDVGQSKGECQAEFLAMNFDILIMFSLIIIGLIKFLKEVFENRNCEPPTLVPRMTLFGNLNVIINRIRKGINYERKKSFYYSGCSAVFD
jgi:hypothetical protein